MKDHSEIEGIIRETIEAVDTMFVNPHPDFTDIGDKLSTLINRQRSHLLFEEMNVYPRIAEHLGGKDRENIAVLVPDHEDPIFGGEVKKEYELIFKAF
jgi:hemerythrin-like domain-containing protein